MIVNTAQGGGGSLPLNLHVQPDEPAVKEGLWIKTSEKQNVKQITTKDSFIIGGNWRTGQTFAEIPQTNLAIFNTVSIGTKLFVLCKNSSHAGVYLRIYDTVTNTWTTKEQTASQGGYLVFGAMWYDIADENNIHGIVTGYYKAGSTVTYWSMSFTYNISTDQLTTTFVDGDYATYSNFSHTSYCGYKNGKLYFIDAQQDTINSQLVMNYYEYDIVSNTIIKKKSYAVPNSNSSIVAVSPGFLYHDRIYFAYSTMQAIYIVKNFGYFDINSNDYTGLSPFNIWLDTNLFYMTAAQNLLYIFTFGYNDNTPHIFQFSETSSTIVEIQIPSGMTNNVLTIALIGTSIWFPISTQTSPYMYVYDLQSETLPENNLAILDGLKYNIKLITTAKMNFLRAVFNNVWWYDTDFREYPTYIGNGTSFVKIKN